MNSSLKITRQRALWLSACAAALWAVWGWVDKYTSKYKTDHGMGITVYADKYVKTGKWVYECGTYLIYSREAIEVPETLIRDASSIERLETRHHKKEQLNRETRVLNHLMGYKYWYRNLSYSASLLDWSSDITYHIYKMMFTYLNQSWEVSLWQKIGYSGDSNFILSARELDQAHFKPHAQLVEAARTSCPTPQ